jgi:hypothetical protein
MPIEGWKIHRRIGMSGGYGEDDLTRAGAFRVYRDAEELQESLDELGLVPS